MDFVHSGSMLPSQADAAPAESLSYKSTFDLCATRMQALCTLVLSSAADSSSVSRDMNRPTIRTIRGSSRHHRRRAMV